MIVARLLERSQSPEDPKTPLSANWLIDYQGGTPATSGARINETRALNLSTVWAAVRVLTDTVASLPLITYRRLSGGGKDRVPKHRNWTLLHDRPCPEIPAFNFFETLQGHLALWGNCYAEKQYNDAGYIEALWPLTPNIVEPVWIDGMRWYWVQLPSNERELFPASKIFHVPGFGFDGLKGYSPIRMAKESLGLAAAAEEFGSRYFGQGTRPAGVIEHPERLSKDAENNLRKSIEEQSTGLSRMHRIMILEEGMKWSQTGIAPEESQFLETRQFQVEEVARWFKVPPHKLQHLLRATFCLPAGTDVLTEFGPRPIESVRQGDRVWSRSETGWVLSGVERSACTGVDEILRIRTTNRIVRMNAQHRVLCRVKVPAPVGGHGGYQRVEWVNEWRPAKDLRVGDTIVELDGLPVGGTTQTPTRYADPDFMALCGLLLADGNLAYQRGKPSGFGIARAATAQYMDHYRKVIREHFRNRKGRPVHLQEAPRSTHISSVDAGRELQILGFAGTAHTKRVPGWVFSLSRHLQLAFLRGFLDGDGSVDKKGRISYSSCNKGLLSAIRHLCMVCGIPVTNLRCQGGTTRLPNGTLAEFRQWTFTCSDPGANRGIGSHDPRYTRRMCEGAPFDRKGRKYPRHGGVGFDDEGCSLARISAIEHEALLQPVYDLAVAGTHSFVADGVIVHNSNIEHQSIEFVTETARPWLRRWEQVINWDLYAESERSEYFSEFLIDGLLRGDSTARGEFYNKQFQVGAISPNEIRASENRNPIEGGDVHLVPLNMVPLADVDGIAASLNSLRTLLKERREVPEGPRLISPAKQESRASKLAARIRMRRAHKRVLDDTARRVLNRELIQARRAVKASFGARNAGDFQRWLDGFYPDHRYEVSRRFDPVFLAYAESVAAAIDVEFTPEIEEFVREYAQTFGKRWAQSSQGQLRDVLSKGGDDLAALLEARLTEWEETRSAKVANRESVRAGEAFSRVGFVAAGVTAFVWVASGDACDLCNEMDGRTVGHTDSFLEQGQTVNPGSEESDPITTNSRIAHPPLHDGCQCGVFPA